MRQPIAETQDSAAIASVIPIGCERQVSETLPEAVVRIVHELRPEKIILFGSYAYGAPTRDSDVDLLVVMQTEASSTDRSWAVSRLLLPRPFPVDILVRTPQEVQQALEEGDFFIREILTHGMVLYERRDRPSRVGRAGRGRLPGRTFFPTLSKAVDALRLLSRAAMRREVSEGSSHIQGRRVSQNA